MRRIHALGYGVLVAVVVFYYLAVPTLRSMIGPEVVLPAYAAVAVLAGTLVYHVIRLLSRVAGSEKEANPTAERARKRATEPQEVVGGDEPAVDEMLVELEADGEE